MRLNELMHAKLTEQSLKHSHHYLSSAVVVSQEALSAWSFLSTLYIFSLDFQNTGENIPAVIFPQALSMVLSRSWLLPGLWLGLWLKLWNHLLSCGILIQFRIIDLGFWEQYGYIADTFRPNFVFSQKDEESQPPSLDTEEPSVESQDPPTLFPSLPPTI